MSVIMCLGTVNNVQFRYLILNVKDTLNLDNAMRGYKTSYVM